MQYKSFYSNKKLSQEKFLNDNFIYEDIFALKDNQNRFPSNQNIDDDELWQKFKRNIEIGAKGLNESCTDDQILESFEYFKANIFFYYRSGIDEILKNNDTYNFLIDLIKINPSNLYPFTYKPTSKQIEIIETAFKVMYLITSDSNFARKEFFNLKFIDYFFQNMNYYSDDSIFFGLNSISNVCCDVDLFTDKTDFVLIKYYNNIIQFIEKFNEINYGRNPKVIDAEFKLIFIFVSSFPSSSELDNRIKIEKTKNNYSIDLDRKILRIRQTSQEIAFKIAIFLSTYNNVPDTKEETYLFKSLYAISDKYQNEICNLLFLEGIMAPFLKIFDSNNDESIENSIDFFKTLYPVQRISALELFQWDSVLSKISQKPKWINSFIDFVKRSTDSFDSFNFLWKNNVFQELIRNFERFPYCIRCEICSIFFNIIEQVPSNLIVEYLVQNNVLSIFFSVLDEDDDIDFVREILQAMRAINLKAAIIHQGDAIAAQYAKYDAYSIFDNLPPFFHDEIEQVINSIHTVSE